MMYLTVALAASLLIGVNAGGSDISLQPCKAGNKAQQWTFSDDVNHQILNQGSCLDVNDYGTTDGSQVWSYSPCHPADKDPSHQNEAWTYSNKNIVEISTKKCLDVPEAAASAQPIINTCSSSSKTQQWAYDSSTGAITNGAAPSLCLTVGPAGWVNPCSISPGKGSVWCDASQSFQARAENLVASLSLQEKLGLFNNGAKSVPRLNIPAYQWWSEALHGVGHSPGVSFRGDTPFATSFPEPSLTAATFNATLFNAIGMAISTEARAFNNVGHAGLTFWAPNVNIVRDPRWGRAQETPGEDPYLTSVYAENFVKGMQGPDTHYLKVSSCCKHYADYDLEKSDGFTRHDFNALVTAQDQADTYLPAFESCVVKGNASSLMCSYNAENGVPSCANKDLMTTTAREKWGFQGYITSDCGAVSDVYDQHHYSKSPSQTAYDTLASGMDIDCGGFLDKYLGAAINDTTVPIAVVNQALFNLYMVQFRLGLFDDAASQPYRSIPLTDINTPAHQQLALNAAHQGLILLKNDNGALPLSASSVKNVAVVGPHGNASQIMIGNYEGTPPYLITPLTGISSYAPSSSYAQGCNVDCSSDSGFSAAVDLAKTADATVIIIGIDESVESEGHDRTDIVLPGKQNDLVSQVADAAKGSVTVIVMSGGALDISAIRDNDKVSSIIWAGYPGQSGGQAIGDVLFGTVNPSGRLPITIYPASFTDAVPMSNMHMRPNTTSGNPGHTYRFYTGTPVYEFGTGLSYTTFTYSSSSATAGLSLSVNDVEKQLTSGDSQFLVDPLATVSITVTNTGKVAGDDVVLCYVTPPNPGQDGAPLKALRGFARVYLTPGESKTVDFPVDAFDLSYADESGAFPVREGEWAVVVGDVRVPVHISPSRLSVQ